MVNYVCRTCLYVCDNEFSFRRLEKVKQVLESFVSEIKTFIGKYSLICEQCYYFLKNVEKFKTKCIETQKKLYSMNLDTIKDTHYAVLQSAANEVTFRRPSQKETMSDSTLENIPKPKLKRSFARNKPGANKRLKKNLIIPVTSTVTSETEITLASLLNTSEKPVIPVQKEINNQKIVPTLGHTSVADELLQLFNSDITDLRGFREFAVKGVGSNKESEETNNSSALKENNELIMNYEEDEYMNRNDLVSAGILSDDSNKSADVEQQTGKLVSGSETEENPILELDISDNSTSSDESTSRVEFKISGNKNQKQTPKGVEKGIHNNTIERVTTPLNNTIKKEVMEDENPGFFNKQSNDGYYKCRLCGKQYKTSKGLYDHTKKIHGDEVKFHHCEYCSFFTLWKSALIRHYSIFHMEIFEKNNFPPAAKCYHCSFETRSLNELSQHIKDSHGSEKFIRCRLCRSRFPDSVSFAKHVEKEHLTLDSAQKSDFCIPCNKLFLLKEDYRNHQQIEHLLKLDR